MKTKYIFLLFISVLLSSCEDIETPDLGADGSWLQFENGSDNMSEGEESMQIPILYASNTNTTGVDVSFTYTSTVPDGFTVEPASGVVNIPAGEFVGYITVMPEDDTIAAEDIVITFSIEGNSNYPLGIAGQGIYNVTSDFTIIEDDCPIAIEEWVGTYSVDDVFTSGVNEGLTLAGAFGESYQMEASLVAGDVTGTKLEFNNSPGFNTYFNDGTIITFITCTKEVIFDNGFPLLAEWNVFVYDASSYSDDGKSITCTGPLQNFGPFRFTITKL